VEDHWFESSHRNNRLVSLIKIMHGSVTATHESHDLDDEGSNPSSEQFTVTSIFY
jgi:hypothetical protein